MLDRVSLHAELFHHGLRRAIGFRVYRSRVQRILAACDAQETGALIESLFSELRHLHQLLTVGEFAVFFSVFDDILGNAHVHARDIRKQ